MDVQRREFLKKSCGLCASLLTLGAIAPMVQSCSPLLSIKTNVSKGTIEVPLSSFTPESKVVLIKNEPFEFDIALVQLDTNRYKAFELQCTHQSNPLVPTKSGFFCNAHGSSFTLEGKVKNEPALRDLKEYNVLIGTNSVSVLV
jgi:Rieske Fe-S protein